MYIGKLAQLTGATRKAIHHYEALGLLPPPRRQGCYRIYGEADVETIRTIRCAQALGFSLKEIGEVLGPRTATGEWPRQRIDALIGRRRRSLLETINTALDQYRQLAALEAELGDGACTRPAP